MFVVDYLTLRAGWLVPGEAENGTGTDGLEGAPRHVQEQLSFKAE